MILVTGASGFLGSHLVNSLSKSGAGIRAVYNNTPPSPVLANLPGVEWLKADLLDIYAVEELMEDVSHVYHCAAIVSYHKELHAQMLHFNVESTSHLVNASIASGVEKFVYVSSIAAIGVNGKADKPVNEEEEWGETEYKTAYGMSKHLAELEVWRAHGEGLDAVIINPGIIIGEGDWSKGSPELMKLAWSEFPFYTRGVTGWVDVQDVVKIMQLLMNADVSGERFVVVENNYSYREILANMAAALNRKPAHIAAGNLLTGLVWRWGALKSLLGGRSAITRESAQNAMKITRYDNSKLLSSLSGFSYTPIAQTIKRMAAAFLKDQESLQVN